jgi:hypothetical protein
MMTIDDDDDKHISHVSRLNGCMASANPNGFLPGLFTSNFLPTSQ